MFIKNIDRILIAALILIVLISALVVWFYLPHILILVILLAMFAVIITFQLESFRRLESQLIALSKLNAQNYAQTEALFNLFSSLKIAMPLPPMKAWSIKPDSAGVLVAKISERKPKLMLELGSGVSTLIAAYCLKELGKGKIISLENDAKFAHETKTKLRAHNLTDVGTVIHAPLGQYTLNGKSWQWYDRSALSDEQEIELMFVDGPPGNVQELARYPAVPLMIKSLSKDAVIILDDAGRKDEMKIVQMWLKEYPELRHEFVETQKGTSILIRHKS